MITMTNREKQIYRTLIHIKDGEDVNRIPLTIIKDLRADGYVDYITPEDGNHPFVVLIKDKGHQFIEDHAQKN